MNHQWPFTEMRIPIWPPQPQVMSMNLKTKQPLKQLKAFEEVLPVYQSFPTLTSIPSLQCHTMPSTRASGLSWNQDRSCWKSTGGGCLIQTLPCDTRQCTGCFLFPSPTRARNIVITLSQYCFCSSSGGLIWNDKAEVKTQQPTRGS